MSQNFIVKTIDSERKTCENLSGKAPEQDVKFSFKKGWEKVPLGIASIIKQEVIRILSIKNSRMWYRRLSGQCSPLSKAEQQAVEGIFKKYGISEIWDN